MLQLTLARDHLLCGYGTQMDPSVDLSFSGQSGKGCRPSIFFGPARDALHLVTKKLHAALLLSPKKFSDLEARLWVVALPGGDPSTAALWREQSLSLGRQIRPLVRYAEFVQSESELERDADLYHQKFSLDAAGQELPEALRELSLRVLAGIEKDSLREEWRLAGLGADWQASLVYWFQPEIGASVEMQSSLFDEKSGSLCAFRGPVCFGLQAYEIDKHQSLPVVFAETGAAQHGLASHRFIDVARSTWTRANAIGFHFSGSQSESESKASSWIPLESRSLASLGAADGLIVWQLPAKGAFELRFRLVRQPEDLRLALEPRPWTRVREADQNWLKRQKPAPAYLSPELASLYQRTLLLLRQMQDPNGGIIAAPEFHYALTSCGGYGFCWGRDAGFISYAMDVCGMHEESAHFYRYMQRCQSRDGSFLHRHDMSAHLGASWGLLQPDETGSVIFGLWQHVKLSGNRALAEELRPMVERGADWLAQAQHSSDPELPIEGHDLWEEREGVHLYTVAAMAAGLQSAIDLYRYMQWEPPFAWTAAAARLKELCASPRFIEKKGDSYAFNRTLRRRMPGPLALTMEQMGLPVTRDHSPSGRLLFELESDHVYDISQLAIQYPYGVVESEALPGAFTVLIERLFERLWRPGIGGIGRYESDYYRDGNPWVLTTLWLALGAAAHGQTKIAKTCWQWVLEHMPREGLLPEQIDPANGRPSWVLPLTWSHAMFALAIHQLPREVLNP